MSTKLDLAIKEFDPTKKGVWEGDWLKHEVFMQLYIEKLYGDKIHYLKFSRIVIIFTKEMYDYAFIDGPVFLDNKNLKTYALQDLPEKYIFKYRRTNKRFTLYPIALNNISRTDGHMLYMLYDKKFNQIEVFDSTFHIKDILAKKRVFFTRFFKKIYGPTVKFDYKNHACILSDYELEYCKSDKYLYKTTGYCVVWVLWFLELRLKNRNLSSKEIVDKIKKIFDKHPKKICEILIGYAQFVDKLTKDYKYVVIDNKRDISLKTGIKTKIKRRIPGLVATLIYLLSSFYIFRKNITKKI